MNDYVGLPNTSKHKVQLRFNYENSNGIFGNIRMIYRSKWAVANTNGNEVYDNGDQFANGYYSINSSLGKNFKNNMTVQIGSENINNYLDANNLPNLAGRTFFISLKYKITNKK